MSIPSDAAVKAASETATWTVYADSPGEARAVVKHGSDYVTIAAQVTANSEHPARVRMYVTGGQVSTGVEILTFRYDGKAGTATDFRADGVRYAEGDGR